MAAKIHHLDKEFVSTVPGRSPGPTPTLRLIYSFPTTFRHAQGDEGVPDEEIVDKLLRPKLLASPELPE